MPIVTHIIGGLGNQMFQYAVGRAIASRTNDRLNMIVTQTRPYMLDKFRITADHETWPLTGRYHSVFEPHFHFDPSVLGQRNCFLRGYWQSPKYFDDIRPILLNEFTLKNQIVRSPAMRWRSQICMHVRRGDYLDLKNVYVSLDLEYYKRAIRTMESYLTEDHEYLLFSDDIPWCRDVFQKEIRKEFPNVTLYIGEAEDTPAWISIANMAHCDHFIIANSTFSWWGAWLSEYSAKLVICPDKWFTAPNFDIKDLYPEGWMRCQV
jgi:hypothetical protein